jgi:hypothetical protein
MNKYRNMIEDTHRHEYETYIKFGFSIPCFITVNFFRNVIPAARKDIIDYD